MSAEATTMDAFVEALRRQIPQIHPSARDAIRWDFAGMRDADDPAEVVRLMRKVCRRVARELMFVAESWGRCNARKARGTIAVAVLANESAFWGEGGP
jgi:hypothetical protein